MEVESFKYSSGIGISCIPCLRTFREIEPHHEEVHWFHNSRTCRTNCSLAGNAAFPKVARRKITMCLRLWRSLIARSSSKLAASPTTGMVFCEYCDSKKPMKLLRAPSEISMGIRSNSIHGSSPFVSFVESN